MSKVAGQIEGQDREALKAFVAMGDTSVPGIETSDINDGDILARTRERVNPNGLFQFVYIPDDGSEDVTSDWVDQEHKKKLTRAWVDGVKSAIISRAQAKIIAAKEAAHEARAKAIRDEQFADPVPAMIPGVVRENTSEVVPGSYSQTRPVAGSGDPSAYVEDQLAMARERLRSAEQAQQGIVREVLTARRYYEKWNALASALSGVGDDSVREAGPIPVGVRSSSFLREAPGYSDNPVGRNGTRGQLDAGAGRSLPEGKSTDKGR